MIIRKYLPFLSFLLFTAFLSSCISVDPVILHGDIGGSVTDAETSEPVNGALVELYKS